MMEADTFNNVVNMIDKEVTRDSLADLCEYWDVTVDDYHEFIDYAKGHFELLRKGEVK